MKPQEENSPETKSHLQRRTLKDMITLFILERARTLPPEERQKTMTLLALIKELQKTSVTEVSNVVSETFNIDRIQLDQLI